MASDRIWPAQAALISIILLSSTARSIFADPPEKGRDAKAAQAALLGVPLSFEAEGQTDSRVKFLSRGEGYAFFLTPQEAVLTLRAAAGSLRRHGLLSEWN